MASDHRENFQSGEALDAVQELLAKVGKAHAHALNTMKAHYEAQLRQLRGEELQKPNGLVNINSLIIESNASTGKPHGVVSIDDVISKVDAQAKLPQQNPLQIVEDSTRQSSKETNLEVVAASTNVGGYSAVEEKIVDVDGAVHKVRQCGTSVRRHSDKHVAGSSVNRNLHLRDQWTVHAEQDNDELLALTEVMQDEEDENKKEEGLTSMSMTVNQMATNPGKAIKRICWVRSCSDLVASPGANWRLCWDLSGATLIGYDTVMIPFALAFDPDNNDFFTFMNWLTMLFWSMDMFFTFFVGFINRSGNTVMSPGPIAMRYFKTWFSLDFVVVAGDWFNNIGDAVGTSGGNSTAEGIGGMVRSLRAIRILRLLRLLKLRRMMAELQDHISSEYTYLLINLCKLLFFILFLNHGIACGWYWLGRQGWKARKRNWLSASKLLKSDFGTESEWVLEDRAIGYRYATSLHWTLTQFTPASMEVFPQNTEERALAVVVLMFALVAFSSFVGSISTSMTALRNMNADVNKQFWMLRRYLKQQKVTRLVGRRILKYLEYVVERKQGKVQPGTIGILAMLSEQLREELTYEMTYPKAADQPFFQYFTAFPLMSIVVRKICSSALKNKVIARGDHLFYPGDEATHVYCFLGGDMDYLEDDLRHMDPPVEQKEWIAEPAFWVPWKHLGRFRAMGESELIAIDVRSFVDECCKSVVSWKVARRYGEIYLDLLKGTAPTDIIRDEAVSNALQEALSDEHRAHGLREDLNGKNKRTTAKT